MPREVVRAPGHDRSRSLQVALAWIEWFCVHGPGDVEGVGLHPRHEEHLELDDELAGLVLDCYAHDPNGRRLYDACYVSRAKGRAKSEWAGFITLAESFGPVRFAGWAEGGEVYRWRDFTYRYAKGEPMGRPVTYPFIRCMATEETQAGNTYDNVYYNLIEGPLSEGLPGDAAGLTRIYLPHGGEIRPSTASSAAKDGGKESFAVFDEPHLYIYPELRRMYRTVDRNLRKRRAAAPWALFTSTMYVPGQESTAEQLHERAQLAAEGKTRERRLFFDHREAPADVDLTDLEAMLTALREVYGPFAENLDLRGIVEAEFWNVKKPIEESRQFFFNQKGAAIDGYLSDEEWKAIASPAQVVADREPIAMFFDGSKSDDATGLVGCRISDGHVFTIAAWEKPEAPAGKDWQVNRAEVDLEVRMQKEHFEVVAFFADVKEFESYVDEWGMFFADELVIDATAGKARHAVAWDMRSHTKEFTEAAERFLVDVRDRSFTHDGDSRLARHALNARRSPNRFGVSVSKEGRESPKKIDLVVCAIGARHARRLVLASPGWQKRDGRTYEANFF